MSSAGIVDWPPLNLSTDTSATTELYEPGCLVERQERRISKALHLWIDHLVSWISEWRKRRSVRAPFSFGLKEANEGQILGDS
jgi:hypothetical protein